VGAGIELMYLFHPRMSPMETFMAKVEASANFLCANHPVFFQCRLWPV